MYNASMFIILIIHSILYCYICYIDSIKKIISPIVLKMNNLNLKILWQENFNN